MSFVVLYDMHQRINRWLLRDDFTTAQSAPLTTPRTCEPGPGTLGLVDTVTGADASISSGEYLRPRPTGSQAYANYGAYSVAGYTRTIGLMLYCICRSATIDRFDAIAFGSSAALAQGKTFINFASTLAVSVRSWNGGTINVGGSLTSNTSYQCGIICRSAGDLFFMRGGAQYPSWTLLWVGMIDSTQTLFPMSGNFNADSKHDTFRLFQKTGAFMHDYGAAFFFDATPVANDTTTGKADGLDYITWTPAAGETLSMLFRRTDDDNTYRLDCAQAGGTIKLYRRDTAVDTELDAGKTQTWTAGNQYRIGIMHAGGEIRTFVETIAVGAVAKHVVTGEVYNLAVTGARVSGFVAAANWEIWPRTFSGTDEVSLA